MKMKSVLSAFALALVATAGAGEPAKMKAILTVPHEFDMLVRSGHIQGLACSEKGIYLSHQEGLAKIDWNGKMVKHIETARHLGGIACADGKIYGSFIIRNPKDMKDGKPGVLRVWAPSSPESSFRSSDLFPDMMSPPAHEFARPQSMASHLGNAAFDLSRTRATFRSWSHCRTSRPSSWMKRCILLLHRQYPHKALHGLWRHHPSIQPCLTKHRSQPYDVRYQQTPTRKPDRPRDR